MSVRALRSVAAAAALGLTVAGCSMSMSDLPAFGPPDSTPARPAVAPAYLPVHDVPAPRREGPLDANAQAKIAKELTNARDRQEGVQTPGSPKTSRKRESSTAN